MKILIADDSKTNLQLLMSVLQKMGHEIILANNGKEALAIYQVNRPDLIILDVVMEGMSGYECAKEIRALDSEAWIPIIFLSANVDDESIAKGIDAGGDDYLTKPCSEITLAAKIKSMQRISDMQKKLFATTQKLYLLSSTDTLTGIYNRLQFDRSIKEIMAAADTYHHKVALLFIDLDNFKNVNDTFGHHIGDLLLIEVAKRLKSCIRQVDFLARLGGDEFAVILSQVNDLKTVEIIAQNIVKSLSLDYQLEKHNIRNGASIGIAIYQDQHTNKENLILNADIAMYHAKASGRNNYQFFSVELNEKYKQQISLEHALKFALEKNQFFLNYQPIFDVKTLALRGLETLIRWEHPKFGLVSPNIFVPLAEDTGHITKIGEWVIKTACEQAATWPLDRFPNFKFAINISSRQIIHENFYNHILSLIESTHISPQKLELELTETAMMSDSTGPFMDIINKLHEKGISISIDDFGTGYSSLIRLKHLPIDKLKIEKSFVQDMIENPNSAIIVNCLIALGRNLNLNVVAEGVETKEQFDFLLKNDCPQGQGHYLSKPLTAEQTTQYLQNILNSWNKNETHI